MMIAEMLSQQYQQKQQQFMFSDPSAYNGYTNESNKNGSYFSNQNTVSHQSSGMQVKLPQIKNQKDSEPSTASNFRSPQRMSQHMERELLMSESEKRFLENSQNFNSQKYADQTKQIDNAGNTLHGQKFTNQIPQQEALSIKKAVNLTKKVNGQGSTQNNQLTENMILRNARFHTSAHNSNHNSNTLNHLLFGSQQYVQGQMATPHGVNLQVSGHKHDILLQEGRKNPSLQKPPTHHGSHNPHILPMQQIKLLTSQNSQQPAPTSIVLTPQVFTKKQYNNHDYLKVKVPPVTGGGGGLNIIDIRDAERTPLVVINKMSTPTNHIRMQSQSKDKMYGAAGGGLKQSVVQSDYSSSIIQQQSSQQSQKKGLNHYDSQKSTFLEQTVQRDQILVQGGDISKLGQYQNSPNTLKSERGQKQYQHQQQQQQQQEVQSEYLSPKLLYKKKKRDFYNQPTLKHGQVITGAVNMNHLNPSSLGKNHFLQIKDQSTLKPGNVHTLNHLINQIVNKPGSNQQSVMQALKNIAGFQNSKDYPLLSANEAIEVISRAIQSQGEAGKNPNLLPSLGRSVSQEVLQDNLSNTYSREEIPMEITQKIKGKNGKILNANELYELAKQIKYKQYQQSQQQTEKRKNNMSLYTGGVAPLMGGKDESKLMMIDALNVVKLKASSESVDRINQRDSQLQQSQSPEQSNNHHHNYLLQLKNNNIGSKHTVQGKEQGNLQFVFRYMNNNNEMVILPDDNNQFAQRIEQDLQQNRDSSRNSQGKKYKNQNGLGNGGGQVMAFRDEDLHHGIMIHGLQAQGTGFNDSKMKIVQQSIDTVISVSSGQKQSKLRASGIGGTTGILISQVHMMNEEQKGNMLQTPGRSNNFNEEYQQQPMAFGEPMTLMDSQQFMQQATIQEPHPNNYYIKEFMKNRNQRKSVKQAQLAKISKIQDLEKLLMMQPGFEDTPILNTNPGGGGRIVNAKLPPAQQVVPAKRRLDPQITDNDNEAMLEHPINKTIKMITILNQLLFKGLKEFNAVQQEILYRCTRYFHFQIPKQYKQELPTLMKQKDFLSTVRERMYITLYNCINKANGITEQVIQANQGLGTYKYYIGGGNNHMLVKQVFKQRNWWIQCEKETFEECNFMWTQWLKDRHIKSLASYFDKKQSEETIDANLQDPMEQETQPPVPSIKIYNKMQDNHCLSDKKHLFFNMRDLYQSEGKDLFNVMPLTYVINDGLNDVEFDKFEAQFKAIQEQIKPSQQQQQQPLPIESNQEQPELQAFIQPLPKQLHNIWIIKPGEDTNRGSGIIVSKDFNEIKQLVRDKSSKTNRTAILQKYIENPLLINKRKFDIRCYGLMTSINGNMLGFFYQDGYLRTSSKEFSVQNLNNKYIHLTNDAIQKNSEDYGKFENANKLSYQDFDRYFAENQFQDYEIRFQRDFHPQIRAMVKDTFRAAEKKLDPQRRMNSFEVFGYDFMIDDDLKLKLIEVNTNPSIEICCPLLARIIPSMLESVFKIAIDPLFQQPPNRRIWSSTEAINDLKMELVFESSAGSSQEVKQPGNDALASLTNLADVTINEQQQI